MTPKERHRIYKLYLRMKDEEGDMHGVSDAANDIRVLEAQHPTASHTEACACHDCDMERSR